MDCYMEKSIETLIANKHVGIYNICLVFFAISMFFHVGSV